MARRSRAEAGFTLVEVLIGITLLAMLGTLIASGMRLGGRAWSDAERQTDNSDEMVLLQSFIRRTIVRARPAYASPDPGDNSIAFAGDADSLSLVVPQPGTAYGGPWVPERFYVAADGASRALFVDLQGDAAATVKPIVLLDNVAAVRFAYFGAAGPGRPPAWQDHWTGRDRLPDLVRVAIIRDNAKLRAWPELVVATRVTANAACIYDAYSNGCRRAP